MPRFTLLDIKEDNPVHPWKICKSCGERFLPVGAMQQRCGSWRKRGTCAYRHWSESKITRTKQSYSKVLKTRLRFELLSKYNFTCQYCGRKAPIVVLHIDHVIPLARGGSTDKSNLTVACAECNMGKGAVF